MSPHIEEIGKAIVNAAFQVHKELGPGLLEKVYEACLVHQLTTEGFVIHRQVAVPISYNGLLINDGLRLDVLVNDEVICELKAADYWHPVWEAQLISYLKLSEKKLGYIINFNVPLFKNGIKRMVL